VLLGSVTRHVARHAECPVVVVRAAQDPDSRRVFVGVDGSEHSLAALEFAVRLAESSGLDVTALYSPEGLRGYADERADELASRVSAELEREDRRVADLVREVQGRSPGVTVDYVRSKDRASRALLDASQHAALVVVGSRGKGAFAGLILGSVSADVLHKAHCPVAVVR
jgi:nucleotide-binding universal stress UspA family protein